MNELQVNNNIYMSQSEIETLKNNNEVSCFDFMQSKLKMGRYDINYTIAILKIIVSYLELHKYTTHEALFGLHDSCKRLLAKLEVERDSFILQALNK